MRRKRRRHGGRAATPAPASGSGCCGSMRSRSYHSATAAADAVGRQLLLQVQAAVARDGGVRAAGRNQHLRCAHAPLLVRSVQAPARQGRFPQIGLLAVTSRLWPVRRLRRLSLLALLAAPSQCQAPGAAARPGAVAAWRSTCACQRLDLRHGARGQQLQHRGRVAGGRPWRWQSCASVATSALAPTSGR